MSRGSGGSSLEIRPGVFVPRPETEVVAGVALERIASVRAPAVVDLGTGSGAIALAVKDEHPDAHVWATDLSPDAVELARANATQLGLDVHVRVGDLFDGLPAELRGALDLVVANPPYVPTRRADELAPDALADPPLALFGDLAFAERLLRAALVWLRPGGAVVQEIEEDTGSAMNELARRVGFVEPCRAPRSEREGPRPRGGEARWALRAAPPRRPRRPRSGASSSCSPPTPCTGSEPAPTIPTPPPCCSRPNTGREA